MTHVGDPDTWYAGKYADAAMYGTRDEHYRCGRTCSASTRTFPGSARTWAATRKTCPPARPARPLSQPLSRLQRHAVDGPRDQRPQRRGPRVLHPQPGPHPLRLRPGQRRRPRLRLPRQPLVVPPQALGDGLHRPQPDLRPRPAPERPARRCAAWHCRTRSCRSCITTTRSASWRESASRSAVGDRCVTEKTQQDSAHGEPIQRDDNSACPGDRMERAPLLEAA